MVVSEDLKFLKFYIIEIKVFYMAGTVDITTFEWEHYNSKIFVIQCYTTVQNVNILLLSTHDIEIRYQ